MRRVRIGVIGSGTVGSSVLGLLETRKELFLSQGYKTKILPVLVKNPDKPRTGVPQGIQFSNNKDILEDADIIFETMGGTGAALELVLPHLQDGKILITANKAMLAECWGALKPFMMAGQIYCEASVMAGTPVLGPLTGTLRSSTMLELHAILSGTCNYILTRMEHGASYKAALLEAQAKGYAEDPPTLDVSGTDAAHKLCVLARITIDPDFAWEKVQIRGIEGVDAGRILEAVRTGQRVKLVGSIVPHNGAWQATVRPVLLDGEHPLAQSAASRNAIVFHGDASGIVISQGGGAGGLVTASAMVGDLIDHFAGVTGHQPSPKAISVPNHVPESFVEL
ncbi:MAG: homoserine dehydrogenase [Deinococcales bacterium]